MSLITNIEGTDYRFRLHPLGFNEHAILLENKQKKLFGLYSKWVLVKKHRDTIDLDRRDALGKFKKFTRELYKNHMLDLDESRDVNEAATVFMSEVPKTFTHDELVNP
jgi:hypothetical protein